MKPKLRVYRRGIHARMKYEVRGEAPCPVTKRPIFGYGYGHTMEQAYYNWLESPIPF